MIHAARKAGTFIGEAFMYRLHPQTREAGRADQRRRDRRGPDDPVELRLRHAALHPEAPALRQRPRRRRHPRCRRLSGVDGAADRRRRRRASRSSSRRRSPGAGASRRDRRRRVGRGAAAASRTASSPRSPARSRWRQDNVLRILGTDGPHRGRRTSGSPAATRAAPAGSTSSRATASRETVEVKETGWLYSFEADAAGEAIRAGRQEFASPGMSWADSLGNLRVLDKWRADAGLEYGIERPAARPRTIRGAPLGAPAADDPAQARSRASPSRPRWWRSASRTSPTSPARRSCSTPSSRRAATCFDTAWVYGSGRTEKLFGEWLGEPRRARARRWSSARARTRRCPIPT